MNETNTTVSKCDATNCRFNSDMQCTAGQIEIAMSAQKAECLTFAPAAEGQSDQPAARN